MVLDLMTRHRVFILFTFGIFWFIRPGPAAAQDRLSGETTGWMGTGSCAAMACHGGRREPIGLKGSEYGFSQAYDPHNKAFSVLYEDRSKVIEKNLKHLKTAEEARPFANDTCLRCHVHQGFSSEARWTRNVDFAVADGVSCEGCHGPAEKWIVSHTEFGWKGLSDREKLEGFGMRPTKDLLARGQSCVECHVGLGSTDVNHDLIAAGHPRLDFEYGSQLAKLPKHWKVEHDKARNPDYEAKVFVLGQLLTAKASLDLLESRATRAIPEDSTSPWPELSEYSCFSCHHELVKDGWSAANATRSPNRGTLQWGTWALPMAKLMPNDLKGLDSDEPLSNFGSIRLLMTRPDPDASTVAVRARQASNDLGKMAEQVNQGRISPEQVRSMLARSLKTDSADPKLDWDGAARRYLAIVALNKPAADNDPRHADPLVVERLQNLRDALNLPMQVEGRSGIFDSPYRFDLERIQGDLRSVQAALPNP